MMTRRINLRDATVDSPGWAPVPSRRHWGVAALHLEGVCVNTLGPPAMAQTVPNLARPLTIAFARPGGRMVNVVAGLRSLSWTRS